MKRRSGSDFTVARIQRNSRYRECDWCGQVIRIGQPYLYSFGVLEHQRHQSGLCGRCAVQFGDTKKAWEAAQAAACA